MIAGVPYDAEIEYLESTGGGGQYIDTGVVPTNTTGLWARIEYTVYDGGVAAGTMVSGNRFVAPYRALNGQWYIGWGAMEAAIPSLTPTTPVDITLNYLNNRTAAVDDITIANNLGSISGERPTLTVFRRNYAAAYGYFIGRVYWLRISETSTLVRDFIPVRVGQVGYMYDRVTKKLFGNAGTGSFVLGPDVATPVMGLRRYPQIGGAA